jgi:hypothetical protein
MHELQVLIELGSALEGQSLPTSGKEGSSFGGDGLIDGGTTPTPDG